MSLIDSEENGATEIPGTSNDSLMVFLGGPIRYWWGEGKGTQLHSRYMMLREATHRSLSNDYLVYAPYRALRGPWDARAQHINDAAIFECDALVAMTVEGIPAEGTEEEFTLAQGFHKTALTIRVPLIGTQMEDEYFSKLKVLKDNLAELRTQKFAAPKYRRKAK